MGDTPKPSRSDDAKSREEQLRMEQNVRKQFDAIAPKRHTKPLRSEYSTQYQDALPRQTSGEEIPEYKRFQELESHADHLAYTGGGATEEFVETEYYKDLNAVDKQHHTTGTGFIHVEPKEDDGDFHLRPEDDDFAHHPIKGNPATNDWIPSPERVCRKRYPSIKRRKKASIYKEKKATITYKGDHTEGLLKIPSIKGFYP